MNQITSVSVMVIGFALLIPFATRMLSKVPRAFYVVKYTILGVYAVANLYETILCREVKPIRTAEWIPLWSYRKAIRLQGGFAVTNMPLLQQIILNILLYVPMGYLLPVVWTKLRSRGRKRWFSSRVVAIGLLCSACTEMIQFIFRLGLFEFDDMINNTLGCLIGYILFEILRWPNVNEGQWDA